MDGLDYVYWDSVTRGSPNFADSEAETYRRAIGVTVFRDGYFYTFSTSANDVVWEEARRREGERGSTPGWVCLCACCPPAAGT